MAESRLRGHDELDVLELGRMLRSARRAAGLSLERLAASSGVSTGLISQLERGLGNPSFHTLRRLAGALDAPILSFVQGPATATRRDGRVRSTGIVRADERKRLSLPLEGLVYELLTPDLQGALEVLRTQVPSGFSNEDRPFCHPGEECVHLLTGALELVVGSDSFRLDAGDTATYDPAVPHWWTNHEDTTAVILGVVTPPSF